MYHEKPIDLSLNHFDSIGHLPYECEPLPGLSSG